MKNTVIELVPFVSFKSLADLKLWVTVPFHLSVKERSTKTMKSVWRWLSSRLYSILEFYQHFRHASAFIIRVMSGGVGSKHLWNISKLLPDYIAQHPKRLTSSYLPLWIPEISLTKRSSSSVTLQPIFCICCLSEVLADLLELLQKLRTVPKLC
jgi:hypothetical protein